MRGLCDNCCEQGAEKRTFNYYGNAAKLCGDCYDAWQMEKEKVAKNLRIKDLQEAWDNFSEKHKSDLIRDCKKGKLEKVAEEFVRGKMDGGEEQIYFTISGYWKDDKSEFEGYIVKSTEDVGDDDEQIFFYGLGRKELQECVEAGENTTHDFVITSFE